MFMVIMVLPMVFISLLYVNFSQIKITITSKELNVAYGFLNRKCFVLCEIESCEQTVTLKSRKNYTYNK